MTRRILAAFSIVSLLLCFATTALWVRSYWVSDYLLWRSHGWASRYIAAHRGSLDMMRAQSVPDEFQLGHVPIARAHSPHWSAVSPQFSALGFACYADPDIHHGVIDHLGQRPIPLTEAIVPIWPFVLLMMVLPGVWLRRICSHRRRVRLGLCLTCGYDLRATPERCPECGTVVVSPLPGKPS